MIEPQLASDEPFRLAALRRMNLIDTPLDERFERITRLAQRLLHTPIAALSLVDADRQWFKSIQGLDTTETTRQVSFCGHTILQDDVLIVPDARVDARFSGNPSVSGAPHVVFYAGCPVRTADGSKIGSLCVIGQESRELSEEDIQVLRDLAAIAESELIQSNQASAQREIFDEMEAMARLARVDSLTRLWNRESIFTVLDAELARGRRAGSGAAMMMVDVDHFKKVNDTLGHAAGDEVLRQTAKRLLGAIREVDAIGRYGGEEFLIVLGACDGLPGATVVVERILNRFNATPIATEAGKLTVTVSIGVAVAELASATTAEALFESADAALYRAKRGGRNRAESTFLPADAAARRAAS